MEAEENYHEDLIQALDRAQDQDREVLEDLHQKLDNAGLQQQNECKIHTIDDTNGFFSILFHKGGEKVTRS